MADLGFRVTVNTDNRLMSATTQSNELAQVVQAFDWGLDRVERLAVTASEAAFLPAEERKRLIDQVIRPRFDRARRAW